jgi:hypothetical protein
MKFFAYIFSFYLILLATVPCCAIDNCRDNKMERSSGHENDDDDCGSCSPFFNCEGCATATIAYEPVQFNFAVTISSPVYTQYQQNSLPEADIDFWQPPKLG